MAYTIQAFIALQDVFPSELPPDLSVIQLSNNLQMIPLGVIARNRYRIPFLPLTDEGDTQLPHSLQSLCVQLRPKGEIAYVEAEIFGGLGMQAHVLLSADGTAHIPVVTQNAINVALQLLGVLTLEEKDEFESVGLGKYRDTDDWLNGKAS